MNEFVTIRQVVLADSMTVSVDGVQRAEWKADFAAVRAPIRLFAALGSTLTVESVRIESLAR